MFGKSGKGQFGSQSEHVLQLTNQQRFVGHAAEEEAVRRVFYQRQKYV